jgi:hypothetical protein
MHSPRLRRAPRWLGLIGAALAWSCSDPEAPVPTDSGSDANRPDDVADMDAQIEMDAGEMDAGGMDATVTPEAGPEAGPGADAAEAGRDAVVDAPPPRCAPGVDSDMDGLSNDEECRRMTDPFNPDSDMDGIADGTEALYPAVCVATMPARQRRPLVRCMTDMECMAGERCTGLSPTSPDTDMDGVPDREEDTNFDGTIDPSRGESDPRLADTDGDGVPDAMSGLAICRPSGLGTVVQNGLPMRPVQLGYAPTWRNSGRVTGTMNRGAILLEDAAAGVAAIAAAQPSVSADARTESMRIEAEIVAALGAGIAPVLVGRALTTHEMNPAITSTYRLTRATTATALRDALVMPLTGVAAPAGMAPVGMAPSFYVDITVVRRTMGSSAGTNDILVALSPQAGYDDPMMPTAIRSIDLVNTTAMAQSDRGLGFQCQTFRAMGAPQVDFLWTVDTSGSMGPYQERVGRTATAFFTRMSAAGIDFRVGVITAGSGLPGPALDAPGFAWINGTDPRGPTRLCEEVTSAGLGRCPTSPTDALSPYPYPSGTEEPTAAAVLTHNAMSMRPAGDARRFRTGARFVTFHVTDEPGSNDFNRYFARSNDPMTGTPWGATWNASALTNIVNYFRRNSILTFGLVPLRTTRCDAFDVYDLPRCVIEGNGGAVIPIATATDAEVAAAMSRIVDAIAGASSQFRLTSTPITSTLKVRVRGVDVPRSRSNGFDYDSVSNAVVFYGATYRPATGNEVVISYRVWQPCPSAGGACTTDAQCCLPFTCQMGRCLPPCIMTGGTCVENADCCAPNICVAGRCAPPTTCRPAGDMCARSEDCCAPNTCVSGRCTPPPPCRPVGDTCTSAMDCCDRNCVGGRCAPPPCRAVGESCRSAADCCDRSCISGICAPG